MNEKSIDLVPVDRLLAWPPPRWLVEGLVEEGSFTMFYGREGTGKTFVVLDLALHISQATAWHGASVSGGDVIYVAAEGVAGVSRRVQAFMAHYGLDSLPNIDFVPTPVDLDGNGLDELRQEIAKHGLRPKLVVIDTLGRCFTGDENDNSAVKKLVQKIDEFRFGLGTALILVHHSNKNRERPEPRGSTVLTGAVEGSISVDKKRGVHRLVSDKMKNAGGFATIRYKLTEIPLPSGDGDISTSCIVETLGLSSGEEDAPLRQSALKARQVLQGMGQKQVTTAEWRREYQAQHGGTQRTFERACEILVENGLVRRVRKGLYELAANGSDTAVVPPLTDIDVITNDPPAPASPPLGEGEAADWSVPGRAA